MKLLFICGCLEKGKDGVGDYTRRLAVELTRQGNQCTLISLLDSYADIEIVEKPESQDAFINVIRFPYRNGTKLNCTHAKKWIDSFNPDWISLQFVPYAFHKKGLPFQLYKHLKPYTKNCKFQIMFHELWVMNTGLYSNLIGLFQKRIIKKLITNLKPVLVHTNTEVYKYNLSKISPVAIKQLILFPNIPITPSHNSIQSCMISSELVFVSFGTIYSGSNIMQFAEQMGEYSKSSNVRCKLKIIGRAGINCTLWADEWKRNNMEVEIVGEVKSEDLSEIICNSSFGIISTPLALINKSGSFAVFRDCGLPVFCISKEWSPKGFLKRDNPRIFEFFLGSDIENYISEAKKEPPVDSLESIAADFSNELSHTFTR
jgi:hypothetical protein